MARRLTLPAGADQTRVLEDRRLREPVGHRHLLDQHGLYAALCRRQQARRQS